MSCPVVERVLGCPRLPRPTAAAPHRSEHAWSRVVPAAFRAILNEGSRVRPTRPLGPPARLAGTARVHPTPGQLLAARLDGGGDRGRDAGRGVQGPAVPRALD